MASVAAALGVAGCGSATTTSSTGSGAGSSTTARSTSSLPASAVGVDPGHGDPSTRFSLHFVAPSGAGVHGDQRVGFEVGLTGGAGGCIGARSLTAPSGAQGTTVTLVLDPAALGGRWCPGTHTARVIELETPICKPGTMCPAYERVIGTVGEASFTVSNSG